MSTSGEYRLRKLFAALTPERRDTLLEFAEFLAVRDLEQGTAEPAAIPEPLPVERPARESVVAAIKRLSASYPMLDRAILLNRTSSLMSQHIMEGRGATEVIDELEQVFAAEYRKLVDGENSEP